MKILNKLLILSTYLLISVFTTNSLISNETNSTDNESIEKIKEAKLQAWPNNLSCFEENFPEPVIFRGAAKSWKILELSDNYIADNFPNSRFSFGVDIPEDEKFAQCFPDSEEDEMDGFFDEKPEGWPLTFKDFWNRVQKGEINRYYGEIILNKEEKPNDIATPLTQYMAQILKNQKEMPKFFKDATKTTLFLSGPGSVRLTHSHESVFLVQLQGKKLMTIAAPEDAPYLYVKHCPNGKDYKANNKSCISPVNVRNPDMEKFPEFKNAKLYEIIVEPGDVIWIPEGWFHDVRALEDSISLSFFYKD